MADAAPRMPSKTRITRQLREAGHQEHVVGDGRTFRTTPGFRVSRNDAITPGPVVLYLNPDRAEWADFESATLALYAATLRELGYATEVVMPKGCRFQVVKVSRRGAANRG